MFNSLLTLPSIKGSSHCDASVLVCSAERTVASEVHWYRVDKRSDARCEHAVRANLITGALTFYYTYLPQSLSPPFSCHCPSLCLPAFSLHLLLCRLFFSFHLLLALLVLSLSLAFIGLPDSHATVSLCLPSETDFESVNLCSYYHYHPCLYLFVALGFFPPYCFSECQVI